MRFRRVIALIAGLTASARAQQPAPAPDWHAIEQTMGRSAAPAAGGVMIFRFPRTDLDVMVGDVRVKPPLALGTWVAFLPAPGGVVAMGDVVLTSQEVAPVMRALEEGGVEVAAVHNHLIGETPRLVYMHIMATGDPARIAVTVRSALALTGTPLTTSAVTPAASFLLDTTALARALGVSGRVNGGVYQVSVPRWDPITSGGLSLPPTMGLSTVINIQPIDSLRAAATGDFVLTGEQVTPVIRALTAHGIAVTAVHSHLMMSTPTLLFVHFWGVDNAWRLAEGLSAALSATKARSP